MMKCFLFFFLGFFFLPVFANAQDKKPLTHDDYEHWKTLRGAAIAPEGDFVLYNVNPQRQDGELHIQSLNNESKTTIPRGANARFSPGGKFAVFHVEPQRDTVRQAKLDEKNPSEMPEDSLGIYVLQSGELTLYENAISYQLPEEPSDWLAFGLNFTRIPEDGDHNGKLPSDTVPAPEPAVGEAEEEPETEKLKRLIIKNPVNEHMHVFDYVEQYTMAENGSSVLFLQEENNEEDTLETKKLYYFDTESQELHMLDSLDGEFKHLAVSKDGELFAWLHTTDTTDVKVYDLYVHHTGRRSGTQKVGSDMGNMPGGYAVSEYRKPSFSDNNRRVFFGIAPEPEEEKEDTLLEEEKYSVDIWHWQDPLLQTQQEVNERRERRRSFETVFHVRSGEITPLASEEMPYISRDRYGKADYFMSATNIPYQRQISWKGSVPRDVYVVDVSSGEEKLVKEAAPANVHLSLTGDYILYYEPDTDAWMSYSVGRERTVNLTENVEIPFYNEDDDRPAFARPYGIAGWAEDDEFVLVYDKYDIWKLDPRGRDEPENITGGYGRKNQVRLRYQDLTPRVYHIPEDQLYLSAFDENTMQSGYYMLRMQDYELTSLVMDDVYFMQLQKARDNERFIWRKSTFTEYADLYTSDLNFSGVRKISETNPQQSEYLWGSVRLVEWQDFNNDPLKGLLYLPEDFDEEQQYPMIVYFYERSSHGLHRHWVPSPSRSTINRSYCTSNGYIVFVPDITYTTGYPGQSAYDAIVSGTKAMTERYSFIDRSRMGLQGQSWGGYQIAYLVTQTNMFRAAMAGAPVSNMISAYGGIRWASGLSRQFQYELTQSRIGGSLWEKPFHYIENSPVFFADKIETPLLMMHNDDDGAVPWYQGIELFTAMRRLDKPVWMLVYNDEAHNLRQWPNRIDLSIRMYQFFDHYLKDKPAPRWLEEGRPFIEKDETDAYELVE